MDKRNKKLTSTLNLLEARLGPESTLRRIELSGPGVTELWPVEDGEIIIRGKASPLTELPQRLVQILAPLERAEVKLVERGVVVALTLFPGDVRLSLSTLDGPVAHAVPETGTRQQFVKVGEALELLQALGVAGPDGKVRAVRRRKYFQVDRFVELADEMLGDWQEKRPFTILDCGCGKSYLSFVLNWWLTEKRRLNCRVIGIDSNPGVVEASRAIQGQLGYKNMEFLAMPVRDYNPPYPVDMVLSLHACDTATDEALALGLALKARYIIAVPCCQAWLKDRVDLSPWQTVAKHSIFKNRLADVLTDGLRAAALEARGYRVSVVEYVSPLDTPKNIMLRAVRRGGALGQEEYRALQDLVQEPLPLEVHYQAFRQR
jgi:hypothetical protein